MAANVKMTTELKNPSEIGRHYRLLCMTGPNKGKVYYLTGKRIIIGRAEDADIQIVDTKISREHAELSFSDNAYTITDLGAQNGIIVNDHKIKQAKLNEGEKIVIGQTVFKYNIITVTQSAEMLLAEATPDSALAKEIKKGVKIPMSPKGGRLAYEEAIRPVKESSAKTDNKTRFMVFGVVLLGVMFVLFGSNDSQSTKPSARKAASNSDLDVFNESTTVKNSKEDPDVRKKLDALIHSGRREFGEGNYFRAMEEFRLALLLSPNNGQASFYLSKSKQRLDDEIKNNFEKGAQEQDSKKYQAAIVSFCGVVQLIKEYPDDERYKNAMIKLSAIESALGMEKGEIKCFEEKSGDSGN
jgi:pSer/pThr/pTyr-binding forkhead associated (FHA) protein